MKKGLIAFEPMQLGTLRIMFAGLVLLPVAFNNLKKIDNRKKFILFISGFTGNLLPALLFAKAQTQLESGLTGILNALTPISTFIIAVFIFRNKVKWLQILGIVLGFAGSVVLAVVNSKGGVGEINYYVLFVLAATIGYGINVNLIKSYLQDMRSIVITSFALFYVMPFAIVYLSFSDVGDVLANVPGAWTSLLAIAALGIIGTAAALILFNKVIQMTSAVYASSVTYIIPIFALAWGIIDGEAFFPLHFFGMALIIAGIYALNSARKTDNGKRISQEVKT